MFTFHLIPHTHWDREWYLTRAAFLARLMPMLDDLTERMERDPTFRSFHLDGQTVLLQDYVGLRPGREPRVRRLIEAGRLVIGPWYVLADEQIPAGESLVRNLLAGLRDMRSWGARSTVCYSPDAFGHPAILPQLAREAGLQRGVLWRGVASPRDLLRWRGPDGHPLLVYHLPRDGYEVGSPLLPVDAPLAEVWPPIRERLVARATTGHIAVFLGADHHAPPQDLASLVGRLRELEPENEIRVTSLEEYFDEVGRAAGDGLDEVEGALRHSGGHTWVLQGVHGTRAPFKRLHGRVELELLRLAEPLVALARLCGGRDHRALLERAWRQVLQSQFHDTLAGTCADPVATEGAVRLQAAADLGKEVARDALFELAGHDPDRAREGPERGSPRLILWNPAPRAREGDVITAELTFLRRQILVGPPSERIPEQGIGATPFALRAPDGTEIPVQVLMQRIDQERIDARRHYPEQREVDRIWVAFRAPRLGGLAMTKLGVAQHPPTAPTGEVQSGPNWIGNACVRLQAESDGTLTLHDLQTGELYAGLAGIAMEPDLGDAYTFEPCDPSSAPRVTRGRGVSRILVNGPLLAAIELRHAVSLAGHGTIEVRTVATIRAGSSAVGLRIDLTNGAVNQRTRMVFPIGAASDLVTGVAFGAERRRPGPSEPVTEGQMEQPVWTGPSQRYAAAADGPRGLCVFLPGFAETEWTWDGTLLLTALRAVGELSRGDLSARPGHAGWPTPIPDAQCLGPSRLEAVLRPVEASDLEAETLERWWDEAMLPVQALWIPRCTGSQEVEGGSLELEGEGVVFSALKPAERLDRMVLRCWNSRTEEVAGALRSEGRYGVAVAMGVRADERGEERPLPLDEGTIRFAAAARQIVTIRLG